MNNTSTFIWFLLYVHHRSKDDKPILATWLSWARHLLSPLKGGSNRDNKGQKAFQSVIQQLWNLVSRAPVLTLGSVHLSLMSFVGVWFWSNPSNFGVPIPCYPSPAIVGGSVSFSSSALRIWSLFIYSLLLIPGINPVPGSSFSCRYISYTTSLGATSPVLEAMPECFGCYRTALRNIPQTLQRILDSKDGVHCPHPMRKPRLSPFRLRNRLHPLLAFLALPNPVDSAIHSPPCQPFY
jgi:hypothetical protein